MLESKPGKPFLISGADLIRTVNFAPCEFSHSGAAAAFLECAVNAIAATKMETKMHTRQSQVRRSDGQATAAPTESMEALSEADLGQVTGGNGSGPRSSNPVEDRQ